MQARFYAPQYHRFCNPDPGRDQHFEDTQSWNIYSYVRNQPTMQIDPTGMLLAEGQDQSASALNPAQRAMFQETGTAQMDNGRFVFAGDGNQAPGPMSQGSQTEQFNKDTPAGPTKRVEGAGSISVVTPDGVVNIKGNTADKRDQIKAEVDKLLSKPNGQKDIKNALDKEGGELNINVINNKTNAWWNPGNHTVNIDPDFSGSVMTTKGLRATPNFIILGHEIGHAGGTDDDGPRSMNNVIRNENPIRREWGIPLRTEY